MSHYTFHLASQVVEAFELDHLCNLEDADKSPEMRAEFKKHTLDLARSGHISDYLAAEALSFLP